MMHRRIAVAGWLAVSVVLSAAHVEVAADMIVLTSGKVRVGHIASEEGGKVRLKTGSPSGPRDLELSHEKIERVFRGLEEAEQIRSCKDPSRLSRWAAGYFHATLLTTATRCLHRALELDPAIGKTPKRRGADAFCRFWNREVLARRAAAASKPSPRRLLKCAKWAHEARLEEEESYYLRQAWAAEPASTEIPLLAEQWGVYLESWVKVDLRAALRAPLVTRKIDDDDTPVPAAPGRAFLTLPLRYDRDAGPKTFSTKGFVRGRDVRWVYGLRAVRSRSSDPPAGAFASGPIYERIELKARSEERRRLAVRNILGPRQDDGKKLHQPRLVSRWTPQPASGWIALVVEIPESLRTVSFEWAEGGKEELDIAFIKSVREVVPDNVWKDPSSPFISAIVRKVQDESGAVAALAIGRLDQLKQQMGVSVPNAWARALDGRIVEAVDRPESEVQAAARSYVLSYRSLPTATISHIAAASPRVQLRWVRMIRSHLADAKDANVPVATQVLGAVLRSDDPAACNAAIDVLVGIKQAVDWSLTRGSSEVAQLAALSRLELISSAASAKRLLGVLMTEVSPSTADRIAAHAEKLNLHLFSPDHQLLLQWPTADSQEKKVALLTVLQGVELGDVVYSKPFADLIDSAIQEDEDSPVFAEASKLIVRLAAAERASTIGGPTLFTGDFPTVFSHDARGPLVRGLATAAARGTPSSRAEAMASLLLAGYADEARRALGPAAERQAETRDLLAALAAREDTSRCYGLAAMMGRLLTPDRSVWSPLVLTHLNKLAAETETQHRWQLYASIKAGVRFDKLLELSSALEPPVSTAALRWLHELGHLTPQDRQRLAATGDHGEKIARLSHVDFRRGLLADGRYGVLAIIESTVLEVQGGGQDDGTGTTRERWSAPRRETFILPALRIETSDKDDSYKVLWGIRLLGSGSVKREDRPIRSPESYCPALCMPPDEWLGHGGWGWARPWAEGQPEYRAVGPAVLPARSVLSRATPDTMTLEISRYLRAGLSEGPSPVLDAKAAEAFIPDEYKITLRYAAFGSFYGVGPRTPLPRVEGTIGRRHLLNVMLVLERME
jgi:hypothetical protein